MWRIAVKAALRRQQTVAAAAVEAGFARIAGRGRAVWFRGAGRGRELTRGRCGRSKLGLIRASIVCVCLVRRAERARLRARAGSQARGAVGQSVVRCVMRWVVRLVCRSLYLLLSSLRHVSCRGTQRRPLLMTASSRMKRSTSAAGIWEDAYHMGCMWAC